MTRDCSVCEGGSSPIRVRVPPSAVLKTRKPGDSIIRLVGKVEVALDFDARHEELYRFDVSARRYRE